jgi:hypothetical protein
MRLSHVIDGYCAGSTVSCVARTLNFTIDRQPLDLVIGGDHFNPPPVLAPDALADLLDMRTRMSDVFAKLQSGAEKAEPGALREALGFLVELYAQILPPDDITRFRERLFSRVDPYDLMREVVPAIIGLVEEYSGRPTRPSPPSSTPPGSDGTPSTAGQPPAVWTPPGSPLAVSAT